MCSIYENGCIPIIDYYKIDTSFAVHHAAVYIACIVHSYELYCLYVLCAERITLHYNGDHAANSIIGGTMLLLYGGFETFVIIPNFQVDVRVGRACKQRIVGSAIIIIYYLHTAQRCVNIFI